MKIVVMVDNALIDNDVMIKKLRHTLCGKMLLALGGDLFHIDYSAQIYILIV